MDIGWIAEMALGGGAGPALIKQESLHALFD
jgi:hypothetical protein